MSSAMGRSKSELRRFNVEERQGNSTALLDFSTERDVRLKDFVEG
jgi:hypothetical protein